MPIPDDFMGREWIELSGVNPDLVNQFKPILVSFWGARGKVGALVGSGFMIGGNADCGVILTARHVLDYVTEIQNPRKRHAASSLPEFLPKNASQPKIDKGQLTALWATSDYMRSLEIHFAAYNAVSDIAVCLMMATPNPKQPFVPVSTPIDTTTPSEGDLVHIVSWSDMRQIEKSANDTVEYEIHRALSIRRGTVTRVHRQGFRQYKWPCFTTSIPVEPGMSGGLVYRPQDGGLIGACGVVCADNSTEEARRNQMLPGESVIGMSWMALGLQLPVEMSNTTPLRSIQQMMRDGDMPVAVGGIEQFNFKFVD